MFRVVDSTRRRRRILNLVQEALSQLRLDMKNERLNQFAELMETPTSS